MNHNIKKHFKEILIREKNKLLVKSGKINFSVSSDDLPDETDLTSVTISHNILHRLGEREMMLLDKIRSALVRIDTGVFGTCSHCGENIDIKRLEARPVSTLCIQCKEIDEKREKLYA